MATAEHGTASSTEGEPAEKAARIDPFIKILHRISEDISEEKFQSLKRLCKKHIPTRSLEKLSTPMDLFIELMDQGKISEDDPTMLVEMLNEVKLHDQAKKLHSGSQCNRGDLVLNEKTEKLMKFLKDLYKRHYSSVQPIPWNDDLKLELKDIYTRLEVREVRRGSAKVGKDLNNLHDIFKAPIEGEHARRVRIEGPPAMGKSTLCRKLAYDWSCNKLNQFTLVFFLEMRHVSEGQVVDEIFNQLLTKDTDISKTELLELISQEQESVLFLFDGLDELEKSTLNSSDIPDHINEKYYSWCTILITTRPRLCDQYLKECDLYLTVKGFTSKDTEGYIQKYFRNSEEKGEKLIDEIKKRKSEMSQKFIKDLLRNPLHISFLCIFWEEDSSEAELHFPETLSGLYSEILNCILKRYCIKEKITLDGQGEIPKSILDDRNKLAFDSFKAYTADRSEFTENDISSKRSLDLGFLVKDLGHSKIKVKEIYFFYHRTWLEFFAALQIAFSLQKGQIDILRTFLQNPNEHITLLKFLAGITDECECKQLFTEFNRLIQKGDSQSMPGVCLECFYESQYPEQIVPCVKNEPTLMYVTAEFRDKGIYVVFFPSLIPATIFLLGRWIAALTIFFIL
ncbi:NACHT, LRR and PYD domains-containing protein 6-like [Ptychodera flava]|uniref:NACHT, LRR and PYD domains-containing protein 6-like n=1 Tax=Ptychodera flava TaxID=63121 RepID=UPI00396A9C4D